MKIDNKTIGIIIIILFLFSIISMVYVMKNRKVEKKDEEIDTNKDYSEYKIADIAKSQEKILNKLSKKKKPTFFMKILFILYFIHILFMVVELFLNVLDMYQIINISHKLHYILRVISIILAITYLTYVFKYYILKSGFV